MIPITGALSSFLQPKMSNIKKRSLFNRPKSTRHLRKQPLLVSRWCSSLLLLSTPSTTQGSWLKRRKSPSVWWRTWNLPPHLDLLRLFQTRSRRCPRTTHSTSHLSSAAPSIVDKVLASSTTLSTFLTQPQTQSVWAQLSKSCAHPTSGRPTCLSLTTLQASLETNSATHSSRPPLLSLKLNLIVFWSLVLPKGEQLTKVPQSSPKTMTSTRWSTTSTLHLIIWRDTSHPPSAWSSRRTLHGSTKTLCVIVSAPRSTDFTTQRAQVNHISLSPMVMNLTTQRHTRTPSVSMIKWCRNRSHSIRPKTWEVRQTAVIMLSSPLREHSVKLVKF